MLKLWGFNTLTKRKGWVSTPENGGAQPFTPTDLTGLALWLDASTLALADDDPVATWPDASGNDFDAAQADADLRPTFKADVLGTGLHVVRFDGAVDAEALALSGAGLALLRNKPGATIALVSRYADAGGAYQFAAWRGDGSDYTRLAVYVDSAAANVETAPLDADSVSARRVRLAGSDAATRVLIGIAGWALAHVSARSSDLWAGIGSEIGGVYGDDNNWEGTAGNSSDTSSSAIVIGSTDSAAPAGGYPYTGDIAEILVYDRALNLKEQGQLMDYLADKWGVV